MRKIISILLLLSLSICLVACGGNNSTSGTNNSSKPTDGMADFNPPENTPEVLEYLKNKYGETFICEGFTFDATTFHCSSQSYPLVLVHTVDSLDESYNRNDFAGKYADDGYIVKARAEIQECYERYFTSLGDFKLHFYMLAEIFPDDVTPQRSYDYNRRDYPAYFTPELYILVEDALDDAKIIELHASLSASGEQVTVFFVKAEKSQWDSISTDDLVWNLKNYTVVNSFSTIQDAE